MFHCFVVGKRHQFPAINDPIVDDSPGAHVSAHSGQILHRECLRHLGLVEGGNVFALLELSDKRKI